MSSRLTKKSLVSTPGLSVNTPCLLPPWLAPSARRPPISTVSSGAGHVEHVRLLQQQLLQRRLLARPHVVAEPVGPRFEHRERLHVGVLLRRVGAARREVHVDLEAGVLGGLLDRRGAGQHDQVGQRDLLAAGRGVEVLLDLLEHRQHLGQLGGLVGLPVLLRLKAQPRTVGAAALVGAAEARRRRPRRLDQLRHRQPGVEHLGS